VTRCTEWWGLLVYISQWIYEWVSEWVSDCWFKCQLNFFTAISWREQVNFEWDDDEVHFVLDQYAKLDFYSASLLKQQSADRHVAPLGHIILIKSQPVFALFLNSACLAEKTTIYPTWGEHANRYTTDVFMWRSQTEHILYWWILLSDLLVFIDRCGSDFDIKTFIWFGTNLVASIILTVLRVLIYWCLWSLSTIVQLYHHYQTYWGENPRQL
jgi:hypothetical protein